MAENNDNKTERISIRVSEEVKSKAKKIAKKENRTLSNWCEHIIIEIIEKMDK